MTTGFNVLTQEVVYRDDVLGLRIDTVELDPSTQVERRVVEYQAACAVVATEAASSRVLLVRQYRHPVRRYLWDLPGGMIGSGETPDESAAREVLEETGRPVVDLKHLGGFHPEPAFTDHHIELFTGIVPRDPVDKTENDAELDRVEWFEPHVALEMIASGDISSSWTVIGLLMALRTGSEQG